MKRLVLLFSSLAILILPSISAHAAGKYKMMQPDGKVQAVEDERIDVIVENIRNKNGDEAAKAYVAAMESGDYTTFYDLVGSTKETSEVQEYVPEGMEDAAGSTMTEPQVLESYMQTFLGPNSSVTELGKACKEAGFEESADGATAYYMALLLGDAKRPVYAENPVYRISELGLDIKEEDLTYYNESGIVVEYEDAPLSDFQKQVLDHYGMKVVPAEEIHREPAPTHDIPEETQDTDATAEESMTNEKNKSHSLTVIQFVLITIIAIIMTIITTVGVIKIKTRTNPVGGKRI